MLSLVDSAAPDAADCVTHKLRLIWKNPDSRRYHEVGEFSALASGGYAFSYGPNAASLQGFHPLLQFPDLTRRYVSDALPAFFANRIMTEGRPSYEQHLGWLGLTRDAPPIEILARTGGPRATDTFHVVDSFEPNEGKCEGSFFVSGVRYQRFDLSSLATGQELALVEEPTNEHNPRAILLAADGSTLGWIPDWLVDEIHSFKECGYVVRVNVEQVNLDSPPHLAVRCRLRVEQG